MSFNVVLQTQTSEVNRVGKNKTTVLTTSAVLKDRTSIIDPVFLIACTPLQASTANYITVSDFGRSYFIRDVVSVRNGLYEFSCHVDVLDSWETQIRLQAAIVQRQEQKWNLYLNDGQFKIYQNPNITVMKFPAGFDGQRQCFALAVAGGQGESGGNEAEVEGSN